MILVSPSLDCARKVRAAIGGFHRIVIDAVADLVPIVKLQLAFYEQHGIGVAAALGFENTYALRKRAAHARALPGALGVDPGARLGSRDELPAGLGGVLPAPRAWVGPSALGAGAPAGGPPRHAARRRRSAVRNGSHRKMVRHSAHGCRTRHGGDGEGHRVRARRGEPPRQLRA